jgi:hypothetical protein
MAERKRPPPAFLEGRVTADAYRRWLARKAVAHVRRDRRRSFDGVTVAVYLDAIHGAVVASVGRDCYTGEELDWHLISQYDNDKSKEGRHRYKAGFALLPTVDHVEASSLSASFRICAWRTNDAKHDLSVDGFLTLCGKVLAHAGYIIQPPTLGSN